MGVIIRKSLLIPCLWRNLPYVFQIWFHFLFRAIFVSWSWGLGRVSAPFIKVLFTLMVCSPPLSNPKFPSDTGTHSGLCSFAMSCLPTHVSTQPCFITQTLLYVLLSDRANPPWWCLFFRVFLSLLLFVFYKDLQSCKSHCLSNTLLNDMAFNLLVNPEGTNILNTFSGPSQEVGTYFLGRTLKITFNTLNTILSI